jgi:hypothetical protein
MLSIEAIKKRNLKLLENLLNEYNIKLSINDLIDSESIYITRDYEKDKIEDIKVIKRIRLMCTIKIYDYYKDNLGNEHKLFIKTKKQQLYTINNKMLKKLNEEDNLSKEVNQLNFIVNLIKELQYVNNIIEIEEIFKLFNSKSL